MNIKTRSPVAHSILNNIKQLQDYVERLTRLLNDRYDLKFSASDKKLLENSATTISRLLDRIPPEAYEYFDDESLARYDKLLERLQTVMSDLFVALSKPLDNAHNRELVFQFMQRLQQLFPNFVEQSIKFASIGPSGQDSKREIEEMSAMMRLQVEAVRHDVDHAINELKQALEEKNRAIESLKIAAGQGGALSLQTHYREARSEYDESADKSLKWAVVSGLTTIAASIVLIQPTAAKSTIELLDHLLPRIIPLSVLVTALVYCLKSYQAKKHNSVLNHHREILFRTLDAFAESQHEKDTKNAIIVMMVRSASEVQPTGYLSGQTESPQINQFNDLKKTVGG